MQQPAFGTAIKVSDGVRLVLASNPGPMTHWGTNTYILGEGDVAIIDPGPESAAHFDALLAATKGETITHILVTHAHADHSPLARRLSKSTGAPVYGFGPPTAGRSAVMQRFAEIGVLGGGEGVDHGFCPDVELAEGDVVQGAGWDLNILHTPGHFAGHLAFAHGDMIFSGDHVMDWSSTLISPPDGDLGAFMSTSERLKNYGASRLLPGHGAPIEAVEARLEWLIEHRLSREAAIILALRRKPSTLQAITERVYPDAPQNVLPAAARNVFAHLIDLVDKNRVEALPSLSTQAQFRIK